MISNPISGNDNCMEFFSKANDTVQSGYIQYIGDAIPSFITADLFISPVLLLAKCCLQKNNAYFTLKNRTSFIHSIERYTTLKLPC